MRVVVFLFLLIGGVVATFLFRKGRWYIVAGIAVAYLIALVGAYLHMLNLNVESLSKASLFGVFLGGVLTLAGVYLFGSLAGNKKYGKYADIWELLLVLVAYLGSFYVTIGYGKWALFKIFWTKESLFMMMFLIHLLLNFLNGLALFISIQSQYRVTGVKVNEEPSDLS